MGNTITPDQEAQYYGAGQFYNPQYFEEGWIEELPQDYQDDVESVENKEFLFYESAFSIQRIKCYENKIYIQNIPTRKVQTIACQINGKVAKLTIDSGSEGDCIREDVCKKLGIKILPLCYNDHRIPTQADGLSP